ncbi:PAS domain S-box protein [Leucothrix sargassi]|nr:PAS domain S-box protein [Leucothrix sargassi]
MIDRTQTYSFANSTKATTNPENNKKHDSFNIKALMRGVWARSIFALLLIALLSTAAFWLGSYMLSLNEGNHAVINISGKQRMLSQRAGRFALAIQAAQTTEERQAAKDALKLVGEEIFNSHIDLTQGNEARGLPGTMSEPVAAIYFEAPHELDSQVREFAENINQLIARADEGPIAADDIYLQKVLEASQLRILKSLDAAVVQYEADAEAASQDTVNREKVVYGLTLFVLLLEGLLIYRPLANTIKRFATNLMKQREFSDGVINTSQALIIGIDKAGHIQMFNKHSEELTGWFAKDVMGKSFMEEFIPQQERLSLEKTYDGLFHGKPAEKMESCLITKSGDLMNIEWSNTILLDPETKRPSLLIATGVDITERKRSTTALANALSKTEALSSRLQDEVSHAAILQKALLPEPDFKLPGIQGTARLTTSTEVGGDYFDYYQVGDYHSVFLVGDVSGHGVASGTLVSAAKMAVHQLENMKETNPAAMLEHINESLLTASHESMFMTMVCFSLDSRTGQVEVANAGHVFPYIWIADEAEWCMIECEGVPLGKVETPEYESISFDIEVDDKLFVYTDGIIEEESPEGEQFGFERLEDLLYEVAKLPVDESNNKLFESLEAHCQKSFFSDDVTLMMVSHTERVANNSSVVSLPEDNRLSSQVLQLRASDLLSGERKIDRYVSRQYSVVTCENHEMAPILPALCQQGVRRVLLDNQTFLHDLGWQELLGQHNLPLNDDIDQWVKAPAVDQRWDFEHSNDKIKAMGELSELLSSLEGLQDGLSDVVSLMADELIENSLYGAPRDHRNAALFSKGDQRELASDESITMRLMKSDDVLGLSITDLWGTFTPATFLNRLYTNMVNAEGGMEAGVGGTGMYLMWRISDYLQVRVLPNTKTQVTLLWSLKGEADFDSDSGFQFLYHSELNETMIEDQTLPNEVAA